MEVAKENNQEDLVSIIVLTYNSADTVEETLDSIREQSYFCKELIISDDCSDDGTVEIVRKWLRTNQHFFMNARLFVSKKNTGIVGNCNRGISKASGKFIKLIAGDDILLPKCLAVNVEYLQNSGKQIALSKVVCFGDMGLVVEMERKLKYVYPILKSQDDEKIVTYYLKKNFMPTPTIFFRKDLYYAIGGFDWRFPDWEDGPFYLNLFNKGYAIGYLDEYTVKYRMQKKSLGHATNLNILSHTGYRFLKSQINYYWILQIPTLIRHGMYKEAVAENKAQVERVNKVLRYYLYLMKGKINRKRNIRKCNS